MLRQNSKVDEHDIEEYEKTEIIRKAVQDVKKRAHEQEMRRKAPETNVHSKIQQNMQSQKKAKKMSKSFVKKVSVNVYNDSPSKGGLSDTGDNSLNYSANISPDKPRGGKYNQLEQDLRTDLYGRNATQQTPDRERA